MNVSASEPHFVCPFDDSHLVRDSRFAYHVLKCRKNLEATLGFVQCPFNHLESVPGVELKV